MISVGSKRNKMGHSSELVQTAVPQPKTDLKPFKYSNFRCLL